MVINSICFPVTIPSSPEPIATVDPTPTFDNTTQIFNTPNAIPIANDTEIEEINTIDYHNHFIERQRRLFDAWPADELAPLQSFSPLHELNFDY